MAEYLILIYQAEVSDEESTPEMWQQAIAAHSRFAEQIVEQGATMLGGNALQSTATATSVRDDLVTDGPFVETKEALGGYYLIDCPNLDDAIEAAKRIPSVVRFGHPVEVRPVQELPGS